MNHTEAIEKMLVNLDTWRHLPKYQLERRADLFFGLFVRQLIAEHTGDRISPVVIPEFPFKLYDGTNHTVNFDYVLFSEDGRRVYILELKTDANSVDGDQLAYLKKAADKGFEEVVSGIAEVRSKTGHKGKYDYLFSLLDQIKFKEPEIILLYLTPKLPPKKEQELQENNFELIYFDEAAAILEKTGGSVECLFAVYLRRWNIVRAGRSNHEN